MTIQDTLEINGRAHQTAAGLPRHILIGYWHNWENAQARFIRLRDVSQAYDVVHVAFATGSDSHDGRMIFEPDSRTPLREFEADLAALQGQGKKVILSVGGATGSVALKDGRTRANFVESMTDLLRRFGFDGIDINLEGQVCLDAGDGDYRAPSTPGILELIAAVKEIRAAFGPEFILSMAPETFAVQGGYRRYSQGWGAYLPVIAGLREAITYVQVQHYNSAPMIALDGCEYAPGTPDFHVALTEMLLEGFPVNCTGWPFFYPLRPDQVVFGVPATPKVLNDGYTSPRQLEKALNYLSRGQAFGGSYLLRAQGGYPGLRGIMTWSINWDATTRFAFSRTTRAYLDRLP